MSIRENFYFVMGIKLTEEQRELIPDELYDSECLLIDGMYGDYCYLGYIIKAEEDEYELTEDIVDKIDCDEDFKNDIEKIHKILNLNFKDFIMKSKIYLIRHYS